MPSEAGYDEVRRVFDYLRSINVVGPNIAGQSNDSTTVVTDVDNNTDEQNGTNGTTNNSDTNSTRSTSDTGTSTPTDSTNASSNSETNSEDNSGVEICVVDADDLLDNPSGIMAAYCRSVGLPYTDSMLKWDTPDAHARAKEAFEKWRGFHEDAIHSGELKARDKVTCFAYTTDDT